MATEAVKGKVISSVSGTGRSSGVGSGSGTVASSVSDGGTGSAVTGAAPGSGTSVQGGTPARVTVMGTRADFLRDQAVRKG